MAAQRYVRIVAAGVLAAALGAGCGVELPERVVVRIDHSRFAPERIKVAAGSTVTFVIENRDPIDHEFIIGDDAVQLAHERGTEKHHGAKPGEVSAPAGETRTTTYTFAARGRTLFGCHLPAHYGYGMRGVIEVV